MYKNGIPAEYLARQVRREAASNPPPNNLVREDQQRWNRASIAKGELIPEGKTSPRLSRSKGMLPEERNYPTKATCAQVACGVEAVPYTLASGRRQSLVYFATELYETNDSCWISKNMGIEHYVFERASSIERLGRSSWQARQRKYSDTGRAMERIGVREMERLKHVN